MESSDHEAAGWADQVEFHTSLSRCSPASDLDSGEREKGERSGTVRSRSMGKLKEWGQYAEHICEERKLRREQQALLDAALPRLWAQRDCPWCWTRGRLHEWEQWTEAITRDAASAAGEAQRYSDWAGGGSPPQPLPQLWRMQTPLPWSERGEGQEWQQLQ